jgi:hypothetical protein
MLTIMAIHWGLPAHDGNPQFFSSTGGTQFSTIYSIQYGCLGRNINFQLVGRLDFFQKSAGSLSDCFYSSQVVLHHRSFEQPPTALALATPLAARYLSPCSPLLPCNQVLPCDLVAFLWKCLHSHGLARD